ncbi:MULTISPECIES: AraC family transcriptional regulator [unclassified Sphingopyxis]|uniref:helix-turn-helix transcriptional regulator n=1 Tax=unclassified Sphingopyxis TaxID=2614943 RepID=UPI00285E9259|nr:MULTISPECIES: AraC family transcriptional regulator [unclassified Sphingopyxis]MDR7059009.1 AraC-like DNA-binding protein [Sphingopyxis sp. BE235]MDR7178805.1 AraC-like DNA-binding protein [Sphingopyxis sp. BE249]
MSDPLSSFRNSLLPVDAPLAPHANPVAGILMGRGGPLRLTLDGETVEGDMLLIRPGVVHGIALPARGADILYLDGLAFPFDVPLARALDGKLAELAGTVLDGASDAADELRARLTVAAAPPLPRVADAVRAIYADPMRRMPQDELARRLGMERTRALRLFRAATGQGFREFKRWSAMQYAAQQMKQGALVRTAAMDAGFADTAHLSRAFRETFGLTPSAAINALPS